MWSKSLCTLRTTLVSLSTSSLPLAPSGRKSSHVWPGGRWWGGSVRDPVTTWLTHSLSYLFFSLSHKTKPEKVARSRGRRRTAGGC